MNLSRPQLLHQRVLSIRLQELMRELHAREWSIPRFMRPFAWGREQRLSLLDSIYRGFPIGSIIAWRTANHKLAVHPSLWDQHPDIEQQEHDVKTYVLDGHQRLATLYAALGYGLLGDEERSVIAAQASLKQLNLQTYFDLVARTFHIASEGLHPPPTWIPIWVVYDHRALFEYMSSLRAHPAANEILNAVDELVKAFRDYPVPIISFANEDLEEVLDVFTRLNAGGQALSSIDMFNALTWTPSFDLNAWIEDLRGQLADEGWGDVSASLILDTFKATLGLDLRGDTAFTAQAIAANADVFDEVAEHLAHAMTFLRTRCGIEGARVLPYGHQLVCLAQAGLTQTFSMNEAALERLRRWFWVTTYTEYFGALRSPQLHAALTHIHEVAEGRADPLETVENQNVSPIERFSFRNARSRALAVRMATELKPRGPDGTPLPALTLLADLGAKVMPMLYTPNEFDDPELRRSPANRLICPPRMAKELRTLLRGELEHPQRNEILASHGFDEGARAAAGRGDAKAVLRHRSAYLIALERTFVESLGLHYASGTGP